MSADKTSVLFNGGRKVKLSTATKAGNEGIKMTKNDDGSWNINVNVMISKDDAPEIIFKFTDLSPRIPQGSTFDDAFPNMPFFSAFDANGKPVFIKLAANSEIIPSFDRDLGGSITLKMNITSFGKTQNPKTQNAVIH